MNPFIAHAIMFSIFAVLALIVSSLIVHDQPIRAFISWGFFGTLLVIYALLQVLLAWGAA